MKTGAKPDATTDAGVIEADASPNGSGGAGTAQTVLVVDDDKDILELVAFRLERAGYEVLTAENGEQALVS